MEHNKDKSFVCTCCGHYAEGKGCQCGWHEGHRLFRVILVCIVILLAFWVGVKLGEFKSAFQGALRGRHGYGNEMYRGYGNMPGGYGVAPSLPAPLAPPSLPPVPTNSK